MPGLRPISMRSLVTVCALTLLAGACGEVTLDGATTVPAPTSVTTGGAAQSPSDALAQARARWNAAALDTYHFVVEDDCGECDPAWSEPREVAVWDGAAVDGARRMTSIDGLFDQIEAAIGVGQSVEVTYDLELGHPIEIWIDREARAYDGGTHLLIHDVRAGLPGDAATLDTLEAARDRWQRARPPAYEYRTDIVCECAFASTVWTLVEGDRVVDWTIEWSLFDPPPDISPMTIDRLFDDLHELLSEGMVVDGGAEITGSAAFHPELGHPTWIGLDIVITDPDSALGDLPPRLVFVVRDIEAHDLAESDHARSVARWAEVGPANYTYGLTLHDIEEASFGPEHLVTVADGVVVSVTLDGAEVDPATVPAFAVPDLFGRIEAWKGEGRQVEVLYDERLGHPVLVIAHGVDTIAFSIQDLRPG